MRTMDPHEKITFNLMTTCHEPYASHNLISTGRNISESRTSTHLHPVIEKSESPTPIDTKKLTNLGIPKLNLQFNSTNTAKNGHELRQFKITLKNTDRDMSNSKEKEESKESQAEKMSSSSESLSS